MPVSRSVVSVLLRELGDFSLHPHGPAATRRSPGNRPHPPQQASDGRQAGRACLMEQYDYQARPPVITT
jgi:hypothetical protein